MARNVSQPKQPVPESRGKPRSETTPVVELVDASEVRAHPLLKSFFGQLNDSLRSELDDFFDYLEVKLDKAGNTVSVAIQRDFDGLKEAVMNVINRLMKGFHSLRFEPQDLVVRLT